MALTLATTTTEATTLEDYVDYVNSHVNLNDLDSIASSADELRKLSNNRHFITEKINCELANWKNFQTGNSYTSQTIMLAGGERFFVRANVWEAVDDEEGKEFRERLFSYQLPHDHNFTFMTVGYCGPGYETEIYEYDHSQVKGQNAGEAVDIRFLERTTLDTGKVMLYRISKDIHSQHPPKALSISLNLMIRAAHPTQQYYFDLESQKMSQAVHPSSGVVGVCRLAGCVGNAKTASLLEELGATHDSAHIRLTALESLGKLNPTLLEDIRKIASKDSSPTLRDRWQ